MEDGRKRVMPEQTFATLTHRTSRLNRRLVVYPILKKTTVNRSYFNLLLNIEIHIPDAAGFPYFSTMTG
jgi:hypothetical protein